MNYNIWPDLNITNKIGTGHFGDVFKAVATDGSLFAIKYIVIDKSQDNVNKLIQKKLIKNQQGVSEYFQELTDGIKREITIMQKGIGNQNIIQYYDCKEVVSQDNTKTEIYIKMEYAEDLVSHYNNKKMEFNDIIKIGIDICEALEFCESINVYHNDIKPENIFLGNDGKYKLGDFGNSTLYDEKNIRLGTLNYISPEKYKKLIVNRTSDLYSLGIVLYSLAEGHLPFLINNTTEQKAFKKRINGKKINKFDLVKNDVFIKIIQKSTNYNYKKRYQTANNLKSDLINLSNINTEMHSSLQTFNTISEFENTLDINSEELIRHSNNFENQIILEKLKRNKFTMVLKSFFSENLIFKIITLFIISGLLGYFGAKKLIFDKKCGNGFINKNGKCVEGYYYCDDGYDLVDDRCRKVVGSEDAKLSYKCPIGYTIYEGKCISEDIRDPKFVYKCADGFTLNGQKCERTESANAVETFSCSVGYILSGNKCFRLENIDANPSYYCDNGYRLLNNRCVKNTSGKIKARIDYKCKSGGTLENETCHYKEQPERINYYPICRKGKLSYYDRMCYYDEPAQRTYVCDNGYSDNRGYCVISKSENIDAKVKYKCPNGYNVAGNQCVKTKGIPAKSQLLCADNMELRGKKCYTNITTDAVGLYECDEGFVASGIKCYKNNFPTPVKEYNCSKAYTLNQDKCEKYKYKEKKAFYKNNK